ncbi:MAG: type 4a pilus biogenesis protein PilO [Gemmatimonadota bacterium]
MALLPDDPREQKWFLGWFLLVGGLALFWFYVYSPRAVELTETEDRVAQLQEQNRQAEARVGNLDELREEMEQVEGVYQTLHDLVPPRAEVPAIYERIAEQVETLGIELNEVTPENPSPVEGSVFQRQQWTMQVEGSYHDVGAFITQVASFPRIVRPRIRDLRPGDESNTGDVPVVASLGLEMFVLPPDTTSAEDGDEEEEGES